MYLAFPGVVLSAVRENIIRITTPLPPPSCQFLFSFSFVIIIIISIYASTNTVIHFVCIIYKIIIEKLMCVCLFFFFFKALIALIFFGAVKYLFEDTAWTLNQALTLGSILAATDPVAVVGALHQLGAPAALSTVIEGEVDTEREIERETSSSHTHICIHVFLS
jgi:hypothetical protein